MSSFRLEPLQKSCLNKDILSPQITAVGSSVSILHLVFVLVEMGLMSGNYPFVGLGRLPAKLKVQTLRERHRLAQTT